MPNYTVKQGDCLSSLAADSGLESWKKIYNHANNSDFRQQRPDPNVIYPGDIVFVPDKEIKEVPAASEVRHRFRYLRDFTLVRLRLTDNAGKPFSGKRFKLSVGSDVFRGNTDSDGRIEQVISACAQAGKLVLWRQDGRDDDTVEWTLQLGALDPVEYLTGVQARLINLGFNCGAIDGVMGPKTRDAVKSFQAKYKLKVDGVPGPNTQSKLKQVHGS
jgi:N-acetylmuramoyl-L-alanine amidase